MHPATLTGPTENSDDPYPGPRPFEPNEAAAFFGRVAESSELARLWRAHRVTILYGPAGSGKTSLLRAGVHASLTPGGADRLAIGSVSTASPVPLASLPPHNPRTLALLSSWSPTEPSIKLASLMVGQFLRRREPRFDRYGRALPILASIDQAEQLFRGDPAYGRALMEELREALGSDDRLRLLLSIREDHLNDLAAYQWVSDFSDIARLRLGPLAPDQAFPAVVEPAQRAGHTFGPGAAEALIDDLRVVPGAGRIDPLAPVEPALLQVACAGIWEAISPGRRRLTVADIRSPLVDQALASFAGAVLSETADEYEIAAAELLAWLRVTFNAGVAVEEGATHTAGMANAVVRRLEDRHLLKAEWLGGVRTFRLQHDRLAASLPGVDVRTAVPFKPERSLQFAQRALQDADFARAERHARRVADNGQEIGLRLLAEAASLLGDISYAQGAMEAAAEDYRQAAVLFETLRDTEMVGLELAAVGRADAALGRHLEAIDAMQSAVGRIPVNAGVRTALAQALWEMGKGGSAMSVIDGVLATSGDTPEALRLRAEILTALGNTAEAQRDRKIVDAGLAPRTRAARALAIAAAHELNAATREIGIAVDDAPDDGPVLLYAAQVHILRGDDTTAADLTRRAIAAQHPPLPINEREQAQRLLSRRPGAS